MPIINRDEARKEFLSQGFIEEDKLPKHFYKKDYGYIQSNDTLGLPKLVYPRKFGLSWSTLKKTGTDIHKEFPYYGVPGYVRIFYNI